MLVSIRKLSLSTLRWVPICQSSCHFRSFLHHFVMAKLATSTIRVKTNPLPTKRTPCIERSLQLRPFRLYLECRWVNPPNVKGTFVQSTKMQRFLKTIQTLSCWYSLESSRWVLSDEYPFARVSIIFQDFASFCTDQISHQQHKG